MAGDINFSGMASGIDTASIVQKLVAVERQPIYNLESKKSDLDAQRTKLQGISSKITALETAAKAISDVQELAFFTGSSDDEDVLGVTIDGDARAGSYQVEVTAVATEDRNYSASFASGAIGLADGDSLDVTIDGTTTNISGLDSASSLDDIADAINSSDATAWATVVGDGAGGGQLLVVSEDTGLSQRITFGGTAAATLSMTNTQLGNDAAITIDGRVSATSSSNTFEDVIEGVIIEAETVGTSTVKIESDNDAFKEKITGFVDAFNDVMKAVNKEFDWTGESKTSANLSGDLTLRTIQQSIRDGVTTVVSGLTGEYTTLASIGITTQRDGTLEIDDTELDAALVDDVRGVKQLFAADTENGTQGLAYQMVTPMGGAELSLIDSIIDNNVGSLSVRVDGIDERQEEIDKSIERMESRLGSYEERLRMQFMQMEQMISSLQNQSGFLAGLGSFGGS